MPDELEDVRIALRRPPATIDDAGLARSAVAAIFTPGRRLWLIRRAERSGDPWSGHLGFPGGRHHPDDASLRHTAERETREELGVELADAELLGQLDDLRTRPIRSLTVRAYVYRVDHPLVVTPNHEVADVLTLGLDALLEGVGRGRMTWPEPVGLPLPCVETPHGRLWGLTLHLVDDLLDRIDGRGTGLAR